MERSVLDKTLCDKICQWLTTGWRFSPGSAINKTDRHDITEILLKVALKTITLAPIIKMIFSYWYFVVHLHRLSNRQSYHPRHLFYCFRMRYHFVSVFYSVGEIWSYLQSFAAYQYNNLPVSSCRLLLSLLLRRGVPTKY